MVYTALTRKAMCIAYHAHSGQLDRAGVPYIFHPIHLAEQMEDEVSACVALLHDVAEDTGITLEALSQAFPEAVLRPLRLLTHDPNTPYLTYIRTLRRDPVAQRVKLADIEHNADQTRLDGCAAQDVEKMNSLQARYTAARQLLLEE